MQARFCVEREVHNKLFYKEYKNDKCIFHFHSQIELYFIDEGEMEITVNSRQKILKKGEMAVSLGYDSHAYRTPVSSESSVFIIPSYMCGDFYNLTKNKAVTTPFICDRECVAKIKKYIRKIHEKGINEMSLSGYIHLILGLIVDNVYFEEKTDITNSALSSRILLYLHENYRDDINLKQLSEKLGYSQSYISKYFKAVFNVGINKYITILRLRNVMILMHEKKHSISYCALEGGFNSTRTFYRAFFNEFGCSPREYVKNGM